MKTTPKHARSWTPFHTAYDRIKQQEIPTGKRVRRG